MGRGGRPGPVAVGRPGPGRRHRTGQAAGHRVLDVTGEPTGLGHVLVREQLGETARVPLADGAHLPGALASVQLQGDHGGLGLQAGEREAGDLLAVEAGDGDEGGGHRAEAGRALPRGRQGEQHADAVHGVRYGVQVHREPVVGGGLPGDLQSGHGGSARVGHPLCAVDLAALVAERGPGHDRCAGRDPDLQAGPGKRVVLPPRQLGRHRLSPCVTGASVSLVRGAYRRPCGIGAYRARPAPHGLFARPVRAGVRYRTGRMAGIRSWKVRPLAGEPMAVMDQPCPARCTFAMIWAVKAPPPASV